MKHTSPPEYRFRAVSIKLVAHLDENCVDMVMIADDGTTVSVECGGKAIVDVQRHIGQIMAQCPEMAGWI